MSELPKRDPTNRPWQSMLREAPLAQGWLASRTRAGLDRGTAVALLIATAPVIALTALLVRLTSRGPAFYVQTRVGRGGRLFRIYKLRTMGHNCEAHSGACWSKPGDTRITRLGRFLRATHLDELPQLWNVLRGDMSLVGPRPERPELIPYLAANVEGYVHRLAVRPGVTGLAQLWLPADTGLDSVRQKLAQDLHYVRTAGPWNDGVLILCTALKVFGGVSLWLCRSLGVAPAPDRDAPARVEDAAILGDIADLAVGSSVTRKLA
ncbi:sugar transferase [Limnoglobus roseus]|uniref:Putative glycosyltransferase n=1 Tax=Limnoglobus roseus TaxID=2598579 RepID=A0A5C1ABE3_9BACT|nr:sugar transferase [Limnoglobus roseus]QEL15547.1 putative glycosyltransferase [Limnoglobus roseus]